MPGHTPVCLVVSGSYTGSPERAGLRCHELSTALFGGCTDVLQPLATSPQPWAHTRIFF